MPAPLAPQHKLLLDFGPLLAFFVVQRAYGLLPATALLMVLLPIAVAIAWKAEGRLPVVPLVGAAVVVVMGGATLYLADERFIKLKPTLLYGLFALVLLGGQLAGRPLLKPLFGSSLELSDVGWRALSWRWVAFFAAMAALNEVLRRVLTTDQWVNFKVFGAIGLTLVFLLAQGRLIQRHTIAKAEPEP